MKSHMYLILMSVLGLFLTTSCNSEDQVTEPVAVSFKSLTANGSATETTTVLTLTFDKEIEGLTAESLSLKNGATGTVKGALTAKGNGVYELAVVGVIAAGDVTVGVSKAGYDISPESRTVSVSYVVPSVEVAFVSLAANGSNAATTDMLTLTFDKEIVGLVAEDITLTAGATGAVKGALTAKGDGVYELAVSGVAAEGEVTVGVSKADHAISPASKSVTVVTMLIVVEKEPIIYIVGSMINDNGVAVATLWKNGIPTIVDNGNVGSLGCSVSVLGDDVYVTGQTKVLVPGGYSYVATVWKNGVATFPDENCDYSYSSCVSGNDFYMIGYGSVDRKTKSYVWKNGTQIPMTMPEGADRYYVVSIFAQGADIYVGGSYPIDGGIKNILAVWKNGTPIVFKDANNNAVEGFTNSVFVSGTDIYAAGQVNDEEYKSYAAIWKNGIFTDLSDGVGGSFASSITGFGTDIYVAGNTINAAGKNIAMMWKNGTPTMLSDGSTSGYANSVAVFDGDVYVAGYVYNAEGKGVVTLWKNGEPKSLSDGSRGCIVRSMVIVKP